jgi:hypothetical protein
MGKFLKYLLSLMLILLTACGGGGSGGGSPADKDCSNFATQEDAQSFFNANGGGPANNVDGLDADHDGIPCEHLPHRTAPPITTPPVQSPNKIVEIDVKNNVTKHPIGGALFNSFYLAHHILVVKKSNGTCCDFNDDFSSPGVQLYSGFTNSKGIFEFSPDPSLFPDESSLLTLDFSKAPPEADSVGEVTKLMTPEQVEKLNEDGYYVTITASGFLDYRKKVRRADLIPPDIPIANASVSVRVIYEIDLNPE